VRIHKYAFPGFLMFLEVKRQSKGNRTPVFQAFFWWEIEGKEDPKGIWIIILYFLNLKKNVLFWKYN